MAALSGVEAGREQVGGQQALGIGEGGDALLVSEQRADLEVLGVSEQVAHRRPPNVLDPCLKLLVAHPQAQAVVAQEVL